MKLGLVINYGNGMRELADEMREYEAAGLDRVAVPEAYSFDAVSILGYLAARTTTLELAAGILPLYTRTPTNLAMTAAGLDYVSGGRFVLGIGASGPQVIEGFHGVKYDAPVGRARETAEICRKIWARERSEYDGKYYQLPLSKEGGGSGLGKPLKLISHPVRPRIPLGLAAIGPKNVELAAELFEEWQPFIFHPGRYKEAFGESLDAGKAKRAADLGDLVISYDPMLLISDDQDLINNAYQLVRAKVALYVGGMGARGKNFYNTLFTKYGYEAQAKEIQDLYLDGKKNEAAAAVPQDFVEATSLIGSKDDVTAHAREVSELGMGYALVQPLQPELAGKLADVATLKEALS